MPTARWPALSAIGLVGLTACASGPEKARYTDCLSSPVTVTADFSGGAFASCRFDGRHYRIRIEPETTPINPSPWYAFDLRASRPRSASIVLYYADARHRYRPKLRQGTDPWQIAPGRVRQSQDGKTAWFTVKTGPDGTRVAAQDLFPVSRHEAFMAAMAQKPFVSRSVTGQSVEGRPIDMMLSRAQDSGAPLIVILGRQHPPEIPGAFALEAFVRTLMDDTDLAQRFRQRYTLAAVPLLNPDGVEAGFWRLNANLVDLNRDWGPFTQPETRAVRDRLARFEAAGAGPVAVMLDFHATRRDVFYTQTDDAGLSPPNFARHWLARLDRALPDYTPRRRARLDSGAPSAKTWFFRNKNSHAITVEFGDETERRVIEDLSRQAALSFMAVLMETAAGAASASQGRN